MHFYMLAYMSMHESCLLVCRPCFNTKKLWTFNPNLHCPSWTPPFVRLLSSLSAYLSLSCLLSHAMLTIFILLVCFAPFAHYLYISFPSIACLLVSCLYLCMYAYRARTFRARAWSPRHKQKGREVKHVDSSQAAMFNRFRSLVNPFWAMYSFRPPLLLPPFLP